MYGGGHDDSDDKGKAEAEDDGKAPPAEFQLIYEEDSMKRRDLLSSAVQVCCGFRRCARRD